MSWSKSSFSGPHTDNCVEVFFHKSTHSLESSCVEVGICTCGVAVRDSKDKEGPVFQFTRSEWQAFLDGVRNGEFDL